MNKDYENIMHALKMVKTMTHRNEFIKRITQQHKAKYIGQVDEEDLPADRREFFFSKVKGDEICIEFHQFDMVGIPMVFQFRLRDEL